MIPNRKEKTMTDTAANTNFDFNNDGEQRSFDVIPANTIVVLQMTIRPGGAGDDGWLKAASDGNSKGLDCEFTIVGGPHDRGKLWQWLTLSGTTDGHAEAGRISRQTLKAILESAHGIKPDDTSETAQVVRNVSAGGWASFDGLRFVARLGVRPPRDGYPAKNTIVQVITPDRLDWQKHKPEQISVKASNPAAPATATTPPPGAIGRPQWGRGS
jgi:hypothetical protein